MRITNLNTREFSDFNGTREQDNKMYVLTLEGWKIVEV